MLVETILLQLVASIPSREEGFLHPRGVEALISLIETLDLEQTGSSSAFQYFQLWWYFYDPRF